MACTDRPNQPCKNPVCGNTLFVADHDYLDGVFQAVWQCTNCTWLQPRQQRMRLTNERRGFKAYMELRDAWKQTDDQLMELVNAGVPSGCLLVHSSLDNYHLNQLSSDKKLSNFELKYHVEKAKEELEQAKKFVAEKAVR